MTDDKLIRQYVADGSEDAFAEIVRRYLKMVYAVCLREVRDRQMAEDAAQTVFVLLAQKARRLRAGTVLSGWLFTAARLTCKEALRQERRRRHYETQAVTQMAEHDIDDPYARAEAAIAVEPWLNDALAGLRPGDRDALLLRYADELSLREIGERYGVTEFAAHRRVSRALDRLRALLRKHGVSSPESSALDAALPIVLAGSGIALPSSLSAATVAGMVPSVLAGTAAATASGAQLIHLSQGVHHAMKIHQIKLAVVALAGVAAAGVGAVKVAQSHAASSPRPSVTEAIPEAPTTPVSSVYKVTDLALLPGYEVVEATSLNNRGEVVGTMWRDKGSTGYHYYNGAIRKLAPPDGYTSVTRAYIGDDGKIAMTVVRKLTGTVRWRAVIGTKEKLALYDPPKPITDVLISGVNRQGTIFGICWPSGQSNPAHQWFQLSGGKMDMIPDSVSIIGVNGRGEMVGLSSGKAAMYSHSHWQLLPARQNCRTEPKAINDSGEVTGYLRDRRLVQNTAFLYRNGTLAEFPAPPGFTDSEGKAINSAGTIAGTIGVHPMEQQPITHAAICVNGRWTDLNSLMTKDGGWVLTSATAINDKGQILVEAARSDKGPIPAEGEYSSLKHPFLLTPIP